MKPSSGSKSRARQSGFTLIELLVCLVIIGILAAIAIPAFVNAKEKSKSTIIISAYHYVTEQALQYNMDNSTYPPDLYPAGVVPTEFISGNYLPSTYSFAPDPLFTLKWNNWTGVDGNPNAVMNISVGLSCFTQDTTLANYLMSHFGQDITVTAPDTYTFTIERFGG